MNTTTPDRMKILSGTPLLPGLMNLLVHQPFSIPIRMAAASICFSLTGSVMGNAPSFPGLGEGADVTPSADVKDLNRFAALIRAKHTYVAFVFCQVQVEGEEPVRVLAAGGLLACRLRPEGVQNLMHELPQSPEHSVGCRAVRATVGVCAYMGLAAVGASVEREVLVPGVAPVDIFVSDSLASRGAVLTADYIPDHFLYLFASKPAAASGKSEAHLGAPDMMAARPVPLKFRMSGVSATISSCTVRTI